MSHTMPPRKSGWIRAVLEDEVFWDRVEKIAADGGGTTAAAHQINLGSTAVPAHVRLRESRTANQVLVVVVMGERSGLPEAADLEARFRLTPRETEVALLLAQRRSNKEIARELAVTKHTAERHTERVLAKLGISSRNYVLDAIQAA